MCGGALPVEFETGEGAPCNTPRPGCSLYAGGGVLRGPHSHKLHMLVLRRLYGGMQGLPATIFFTLGLSLPVAVVWVAFSCPGAKG